MKKSMLVIAALAFGVTGAFAQDLTSKKGETFLPESGDWSIGIDATPFLTYVGGFFSNAGAVAPTWNFLNTNQTIIGKMYTSETSAYRAIIRLGMTSQTQKAMIGDATQTTPPSYPNLPAMKEDKWKHGSHFIGLGAGIEMRRGKTRLQGFYGGDAMFWMSGGKDAYTYGNALSVSATQPVGVGSSTNFGTNITTDTYGNAARITESKTGGTLGIGVRGFIGAEYFIVPKISIGAEFGWGVGFQSTGASSTTLESIGGAPAQTGTQTIEGSKSSSLVLDTDRNVFGTGNGTLRLNLHF